MRPCIRATLSPESTSVYAVIGSVSWTTPVFDYCPSITPGATIAAADALHAGRHDYAGQKRGTKASTAAANTALHTNRTERRVTARIT